MYILDKDKVYIYIIDQVYNLYIILIRTRVYIFLISLIQPSRSSHVCLSVRMKAKKGRQFKRKKVEINITEAAESDFCINIKILIQMFQ